MSDISTASNELKNFLNKFKGLQLVSDAMEKISSLDQAEKESIIRKEKANAEERNALIALEQTKKSLDVAEQMIQNAQVKAVEIEEAAREKAAVFSEKCKAKGEEILAEYVEKKNKIQNEILKLSNELSLVSSELASEKDRLKEAQESLAKVKQHLSKILSA